MQGPRTILIIDDSPEDRELYARLFRRDESNRWFIIEAQDGTAGLAALDNQPVDCVLLDFSLPGRDGLQVLDAIKARDAHLTVVMLTGAGDERVAVTSIQKGAEDYLPKDAIADRGLVRTVNDALARSDLRRRLAEQKEALESFARILAHDLRAPTRAIRSFLEIIEEEISDKLDDTTIEFFRQVTGAAERMDELIDDLSDYTRLDSLSTQMQEVRFETILSKATANLHSVISDAGAKVSHGDMPTVLCNETEMIQLMQNLVGNAVKYCEAAVPTVRIEARQEEGGYLFRVQDNGIGIDPQHRDRIFEPFKRLHGETEYSGTGLGLATCRKIVERHGGRIWCEAGPDEGTCFCFRVPNPSH